LLRAAEGAGGWLGPWLAHRDFQPTGPTPHRASVPQPAPGPGERLRRSRRRHPAEPRAAILLYHRVASRGDRLAPAVSPAHFAEHLEVLRTRWQPLALGELAAGVRLWEVPDRAVAVSFDDGYADNLHRAAAALAKAEVPGTFFVTTG